MNGGAPGEGAGHAAPATAGTRARASEGDAPFPTQLRVRPRHCDAQGLLHAARFYEYFEEAFLRWLTSVSLPCGRLREDGIDLVIVESGCVHRLPARLDDGLRIADSPSVGSTKALHVRFDVHRHDTLIAEGRSTYLAVSDGHAVDLPERLRSVVAEPNGPPLSMRGAIELLHRLHNAQQRFYTDGARDDLDAVLAPDVTWHIPGSSPIGGTHVGIDEVVRYMTARRELAAATFRIHPGEVMVGGNHVARLTDGTVEIDDRRERWSTIGLYRVRGGRIREARLVAFDQGQFDRIWSSLVPPRERQGDQAPDQRRRHLPQPGRVAPPRRHAPGRAGRRVGRGRSPILQSRVHEPHRRAGRR